MPKVSLILPVYNVEAYIFECLESLVNQTLSDIEIICINDASPDGSWDIVQKYAAADKRFVLISLPENHGQGYARNQGLEKATGEYIMFVDPDDWLELNACELAYNQIKKNNNDFLWFGMSIYNENKQQLVQDKHRLSGLLNYIGQSNVKLSEINEPFLKTGEVCNKIYKRSLIEQHHIRFGEGRASEDITFTANFLLRFNDMSIINAPLYIYRVRDNSSTAIGTKYLDEFCHNRNEGVITILSSAAENIKKAYLIWHIIGFLYWYKRYSETDNKVAKSLYSEMRKSFILIANKYDISEIQSYIKYSEFKRIIKYTWFEQKVRKLLKQLFSIKKSNNQRHKVITILGIKFKINREKQKMAKIRQNYAKTLSRLQKKAKTRKLNVVFLVNEISKWKYQSLYELLDKSDKFSPMILLVPVNNLGVSSIEKQQMELNKTYNSFKTKNMRCEFAFDFEKSEPLDINNFDADIIFYQQPWAIKKEHSPAVISERVLCMYEPYYVPNYGDLKIDCNLPFHKEIFRYYVLTKQWQKLYEKNFKGYRAGKIKALGHTMLDDLTFLPNHKSDKNYVIYAPHWSIGHINNPNFVNYSTFDNTGKEILEFAQQHPEISWVFKPHPNLKYALQRIGWSEQEITAYYQEWEKIAKCCYDADYVELFLQSKAMITDCGSFLIEYFVTGKPLIHLISDDCKETPLEPSKAIFDTFYKAKTLEEMYRHFKDIIIEDNDYMRETRLKTLEISGLKGNNAARNIYNDLLNLLEIA